MTTASPQPAALRPSAGESPAGYAARAASFLEASQDPALAGIGYALLAIGSQLAGGAAARPRKPRLPWRGRDKNAAGDGNEAAEFTRLGDVMTRVSGGGTAGEHAEAMLAGYRAVMASLPAAAEETAPAQTPDETVLAALAELHALADWRRLEASTPDDGGYAGYCVTADGRQVLAADALRNPAGYPAGVAELAALLGASGWRRLQVISGTGIFGGRPHGWCERGDGTGVSLADVLERAARVPAVTVPRYDAPRVTTVAVTQVISPEPVSGRPEPGHYQQVMLDTRTGELRFYESAEHLEAPDGDVAWDRWHPGELFVPNGGPHMWFEPVPGLLYWVVDSGRYVPGLPYLDAAAANALLGEVAPYAQALLDGLWDTGELDWSAASAAAGRHIERLCSRERRACGRTEGLADYGDIVARLPHVYQPALLTAAPDKLAGWCESITRFLGCNEHWHPEVTEAFGAPCRSDNDSYLVLDKLGVRAWYRAAAGVTS
jgi:putative hemolysin